MVIKMPTVAVKIPYDLKNRMEKHKEIDWDVLIQKAIKNQLSRIELADSITSKSELTEDEALEISEDIKKGMAERHGLIG
ncbi:MAG: hypothetical protein R6U61_08730 [Thermoplasmata archaeon]